jgi:hypothetical protein
LHFSNPCFKQFSTKPSKLDYEGIVKSITEKAKSSGVKEELIKEWRRISSN